MKAVVYKEPYKVAVEEVEDARIQDPTDVVIRITSTAICGSDLHMYEGRTGAEPGIVFGHENMGIVEEVGRGVASLSQGDRICLTVNEGFAGGAYGYVSMGPYKGGRASTCVSRSRTSTRSSCHRAMSTRPTSRCSPTSSPPATTARRWPTSAPVRRSRSTAPGRSV